MDECAPDDLKCVLSDEAPLQDYYFREEYAQAMSIIQAADLNAAFDDGLTGKFIDSVSKRCSYESPDIANHIDQLPAADFKQIFDNALDLIERLRSPGDHGWVGWQDPWTIEFFPHLLRAYPDAKSIVLVRDPRGIIASNQAALTHDQMDDEEVGQVLSYARHWRMLVAYIIRLNAQGFGDRLHVVRYEDLVSDPSVTMRGICEFLALEYSADMIDPGKITQQSNDSAWKGNSSFQSETIGLNEASATRWTKTLDQVAHQLVEFLCGPEMELMDYALTSEVATHDPSWETIQFLIDHNDAYANWRSDIGDPLRDSAYELFRRKMLLESGSNADPTLIRRCFLFEEVFEALRQPRSTNGNSTRAFYGCPDRKKYPSTRVQ